VAMKVLKPTEGTFRVRPVARSHTAEIAQTIATNCEPYRRHRNRLGFACALVIANLPLFSLEYSQHRAKRQEVSMAIERRCVQARGAASVKK
jgi:hypothetical protein